MGRTSTATTSITEAIEKQIRREEIERGGAGEKMGAVGVHQQEPQEGRARSSTQVAKAL